MYMVKRDGLYLMGYLDTGVKGYDASGEYKTMLTGIYSMRRRDAMMFESKALAESFGGDVIRVEDGGWGTANA
jgi:hypothetical protein